MRCLRPYLVPLTALFASALVVQAGAGRGPPQAFASEGRLSPLSGVWTSAETKEQVVRRRASVEAATVRLPRLIQRKAADEIEQRTAALREFQLRVTDQTCQISHDGSEVVLGLDGAPHEVTRGEKRFILTARQSGGTVIVDAQTAVLSGGGRAAKAVADGPPAPTLNTNEFIYRRRSNSIRKERP